MSEHTVFTDKPTLVGSAVTLRPIRASDVETLDQLMRNDQELLKLTGSSNSSDAVDDLPALADLQAIYQSWATANDRLVLAVCENSTSAVVGEMVLKDLDEPNQSASFRGMLGAGARNRGLGSEAVQLIVNYGLTQARLHRISLEVYAHNPRAQHVYEKVGFKLEGVGKDALQFDGQWIDVHYMAILADDAQATQTSKPRN